MTTGAKKKVASVSSRQFRADCQITMAEVRDDWEGEVVKIVVPDGRPRTSVPDLLAIAGHETNGELMFREAFLQRCHGS